MDKEYLNSVGTSLALDDTQKAYKLGGKEISWVDYAIEGTDTWDEEKYYADFDKWWTELPAEQQEKILFEINTF
jgi:hypothetical protein